MYQDIAVETEVVYTLKQKIFNRQPGFEPITFIFSENNWRESLLEVSRQNIAGQIHVNYTITVYLLKIILKVYYVFKSQKDTYQAFYTNIYKLQWDQIAMMLQHDPFNLLPLCGQNRYKIAFLLSYISSSIEN